MSKEKKEKQKKVKTNKTKGDNTTFLFKVLVGPIKFVFVELFMLIKNIGLGVFTFFDRLITYSFTFFTYIFFGIKTIIDFLWSKFFGALYHEIVILLKSLSAGFIYITSKTFYEFPRFIFTKSSTFVFNIYSKIKRNLSYMREDTSLWPERIKAYFKDKFDNLEIVKQQRMKRESQLVMLEIDKTGDDAKRSEVKQTYKYLARNKDGRLIKGYFAALSRLDVYSWLLDGGNTIYEIETNWWINFAHAESRALKNRMAIKDLVFWLAQLSTYIKSGIPLTESVKILAKQDKRKKYKGAYDSIIYELTMGESFSEALQKQGSVFPALLVNMIKAAELIGDIETTLDEMSDYYKQAEETKKAMISALTYPTIILVFAIGVVTFIMLFIIPQFVGVYNSIGAELNDMTVTVLNMSSFLQNNYLYILIALIVFGIVYGTLYKNLKAFRSTMQYIFMHIPVLKKIIIFKEIGLFSKTFATLNKNNILLTESIDILSKITNNEIYKTIMFHTIANLLRGDKMSDSFKDNWAVPEIAYYMISTGESTGELAEMLEKVSEYYTKEQKNLVNTIKTFIEPTLIAILAIVVGGIIISIIVPMFGLYSSIQ